MSELEMQQVNVTVAEGQEIQEVAGALGAAGLRVSRVLSTVGVVSGEVPVGDIEKLKAVPGVLDVEPDQEMHMLGPDD